MVGKRVEMKKLLITHLVYFLVGHLYVFASSVEVDLGYFDPDEGIYKNLFFSQSYGGQMSEEDNSAEEFEIKVGQKVRLSATPNSGFFFSHWEVNGEKLSEEKELDYVMPNKNVAIVGHFRELVAPNIRILSPTDNVTIESNKDIPVRFEASSDNGKITRIELFRNGNLLGSIANPNNNFTLTNLPIGNHTLRARVTDERGAVAESAPVRIEVVKANVPPVVQIISPNNGEVFQVGENIRIEAEAMDSDGEITKVEFFSNGALIGTSTSSPYLAVLGSVGPGRYELRAKATDDKGAETNSNMVTIIVEGERRPPVVSITSPSTNSRFYSGDNIDIKINASSPDGQVARVELFRGNSRIATLTQSPYNFTWRNAPLGRHNLVARAFDDRGAQTNSAVVAIEVLERIELPGIALVTPVNNQVFDQGAEIGMMVMFEGNDEPVEKVEYFRGNQLIGTSSSSPFQFTWKNAPVGKHQIRAVAHGGRPMSKKESEPIQITVDPKSSTVFAITAPVRDARSYEGMDITIRVQLPQSSRAIKNVEFFRGNQRIGSSSNAPYNFTWRNVPAGQHNLVARLNYEDGTRIISTVVRIFVEEGDRPEMTLDFYLLKGENDSTDVVRFMAEIENVRFDIAEVRFLLDGRVIGVNEGANFIWDWRDVRPGRFTARAMAIDIYGNRITSDNIPVVIGPEEKEEDKGPAYRYKIGPNPTVDYITIYFEGLEEEVQFEVVTASMNGTITKQYLSKTEAATLTVDFNDYIKGIYVLFLNIDGKTVLSEKIIKN